LQCPVSCKWRHRECSHWSQNICIAQYPVPHSLVATSVLWPWKRTFPYSRIHPKMTHSPASLMVSSMPPTCFHADFRKARGA
jgi:hypothetical protein